MASQGSLDVKIAVAFALRFILLIEGSSPFFFICQGIILALPYMYSTSQSVQLINADIFLMHVSMTINSPLTLQESAQKVLHSTRDDNATLRK